MRFFFGPFSVRKPRDAPNERSPGRAARDPLPGVPALGDPDADAEGDGDGATVEPSCDAAPAADVPATRGWRVELAEPVAAAALDVAVEVTFAVGNGGVGVAGGAGSFGAVVVGSGTGDGTGGGTGTVGAGGFGRIVVTDPSVVVGRSPVTGTPATPVPASTPSTRRTPRAAAAFMTL